MKIVITGPRSAGKTTIGKLLAKKINSKYISSDELMDEKLKEFGGLDKATKLGKKELIYEKGVELMKEELLKEDFVFDVAGGSLKPEFRKLIKPNMKKVTSIGLVPSLNDEKAFRILYERERRRSHFNHLNNDELFEKTKKDYLKIKNAVINECNINIIIEEKTPKEIVKEITLKLK